MKNKALIISLASIGAVILILIISVITSYNGLVDKEEAVKTAQSTISVQLQRRADLIPNFVETIKGYSDYEQSTLTAVTEARSAVLNANGAEEQAAASAQLDSAIDVWVNAVTEAYPELKASEQYKGLQDELAGTENRIAYARKEYNSAATSYNKSVRRFPGSIVAGMFGFDQVEYFEASEKAEDAPQISMD